MIAGFKYIISIVLIMSWISGTCQVDIYHKYDDGKLMIRWNPTDPYIWERAHSTGYTITKYKDGEQIRTTAIKAADYQEKEMFTDDSYYEFIINQAIYIENVDPAIVEETYPKDSYTDARILRSRYEVTNYLQHADFGLSMYAGLGFQDTDLDNRASYKYVLKSVANLFEPVTLTFSINDYQPPVVPELMSDWDNRRALLKWNTAEYRPWFYGYMIHMSTDDVNYSPIDDNVYVNLMDTIADFQFYEKEVIVDENDKTYYFRLLGHDYFGGVSKHFTQVSGKASEGIAFCPIIHKAEQKVDNTCDIKWSMMDKFLPLVKSYNLYAAPSWEGPYLLDTAGIAPTATSINREIVFGANYWRLAAVDEAGEEHSSFPKLVMSRDTIAPATPTNIVANIDSNGIVNLTWDPNDEEDFIGYKVFYTHDTLLEYVLDHLEYVEEPKHTDTLFLRTYQKYTYYKIISVDARNNRSPYSDIIAVKKPDILPPVEPNFTHGDNLKGRVVLQWNSSSSPDVMSEQLYRKPLKSDDGWRLLKEWKTEDFEGIYIDSLLEPKITYAYILTAKDEDGNTSIPSRPITGEIIKSYDDFPIDNFSVTKEKKFNRISWTYPKQDVFEIWIYKIEDEEKPRLLRKLAPSKTSFDDPIIKKRSEYQYFLRVYFNEGEKTNYSIKKKPQ